MPVKPYIDVPLLYKSGVFVGYSRLTFISSGVARYELNISYSGYSNTLVALTVNVEGQNIFQRYIDTSNPISVPFYSNLFALNKVKKSVEIWVTGSVSYTGTTRGFNTGLVEGSLASITIPIPDDWFNTAPTINLHNSNNEPITKGQSIYQSDKNDFAFKITPNDADSTDTLQYSVKFNGVIKTQYTSCQKGVQFEYTILFNTLLLGNNSIEVMLKDSSGTVTSFPFVIRNKTPETLSLRSTREVISALGYTGASIGSLSELKPTSYTSPTISFTEIINSLN